MAGQSNRNAALKPPMKAKPAEVQESIPMLDLRAQYAVIGEEIRAALDEVLAEQQFILGPQVAALEEEVARYCGRRFGIDRKSTRLNSSHSQISYAVFCLKKKKK